MKKFENYCSNLTVLSAADQQDLNNEFIIGGIIDKFTIQFELGWKVLKERLRYEGRGEANSGSHREILKTAFELYDFVDEELWLAMLKDRNSMNHIYDGQAARDLVQTILERYIPAFQLLRTSIAERYAEQLEQV